MDKFERPVIGIPKWWWKLKARKYAIKHPNIVVSSLGKDLCHECSRHFELLDIFDQGVGDYIETEYFEYQRGTGKKARIIAQNIDRFKKMYFSIKDNSYSGGNYPIITEDGCRIDGSHRLAILVHLKIEKTSINVFRYEDIFSHKKSSLIRGQVKDYRKDKYGL